MNLGAPLPQTPPPPRFREKLSWCLFDFANSSFTTVIVTVVFAQWFVSGIVGEQGWGGLPGESWWAIAFAASQIVVIVTAPIVGAMADRLARTKTYLLRTWLVCVGATALLAIPGPGAVLLAMGLFMVANVAFSMGENIASGFLPELARPEEMGRLSGYAWAVGYVGGLLALVAARPFAEDAPQITCLTTAGFFLLGGLPTFLFLRERARPRPLGPGRALVREAFAELRVTWRERRRFRDLFVLLGSILLVQGGVSAVILFSSVYAAKEIGLGGEDRILLFAGLQIAAALGAVTFGFLQDRIGSRFALGMSLVLWIVAAIGAWWSPVAPDATAVFVAAAILAGAAMGASQSAGRALVGLFCPAGREAEWFGLWGLAMKTGAVLGSLLFGLVVSIADSRSAVLSTAALFLLGLTVLLGVNVARGRAAAGRA